MRGGAVRQTRRRMTVVGGSALMAVLLGGAAAGEKDVSAARIREWIAQLSHSEYKTREEATQALKAVGPDARPALQEALASADPEVRFRAQVILEHLNFLAQIGDVHWLGERLVQEIVDRDKTIEPIDPGAHLRLGVTMLPLWPALAERLRVGEGVVIGRLQEGSAAARGGLKAWDVVLSFDGKPVASPAALQAAVAEAPRREPVAAEVIRLTAEGKRLTVSVVLDDPPGELAPPAAEPAQ